MAASVDCKDLAQSIGDLLLTHGILPYFEYRRELTDFDVARGEVSSHPSQVAVWILMQTPKLARLVFADPQRQRFLVRKLPLPQGLDPLGRESIAQVVESSLLVLLQGSSWISRVEAEAELGPYLESGPAPRHAVPLQGASSKSVKVLPLHVRGPKPNDPTKSIDALPSHAREPTMRLRLGADYAMSMSGADLGLQQGPGVTSGLEWIRNSDSLFVETRLEWHFERSQRTANLELGIQSSFAWVLFGWRKPWQQAAGVVLAGPGVEVDRVSPRLLQSRGTSAEPFRVYLSPWARLAAGFEVGNTPWVLQFLGTVDISLYRTHYDIEHNGIAEPLAAPWSVRPGVSVAALWR